jgi:ABC-type tungstate transport system substrate-binding protein
MKRTSEIILTIIISGLISAPLWIVFIGLLLYMLSDN